MTNRKTLFYSVHFYFVTTVKYTNITLQGLTKSETQKVIGGKTRRLVKNELALIKIR